MDDIRTELHFHLLPGVDDGPDDLDEALDLARLAVADGTAAVVCTSHAHRVDIATVPDRVRELQAALDAALIPIGLRAGAEVSPGTFLSDAELATIAQGPPGREWVLLEGPIAGATLEAFHATADHITARGYGLVIAHPERSPDLVAPGGGLGRRLLEGAQIQVNASSIAGFHGPRARAAGLDLVRRGLVTALASDAHGADRPPRLT